MTRALVETKLGWVRGVLEDGAVVWRGIPFARAPVGDLRFRAPVPAESWAGVRPANEFGPIAVQPPTPDLLRSLTYDGEQSEDCLNLNIWAPSVQGSRRPVLVWIHGGSLSFGSGSAPLYDGAALATRGDVVVVTLNYRLGPFGFLYLDEASSGQLAGSANCGLLDQLAALLWVKDNIAAFGGDPNNVTLAGQSAGAFAISCLLAMPQARGVFHRVILESGSMGPAGTSSPALPDQAHQETCQFLAALGLAADETAALTKLSSSTILAAAEARDLRPVLDGSVRSCGPLPLLCGTNRDEGLLWRALGVDRSDSTVGRLESAFPDARAFYLDASRRRQRVDAYLGLLGGGLIVAPLLWLIRQLTGYAPIWTYRFDWAPVASGALEPLGACHGMEVPFVFDTLAVAPELVGEAPDHDLADCVQAAWLSFVRTAVPGDAQLPRWPRYGAPEHLTMVFDTVSRIEADPDGDERRLWERLCP